MSMDIGGKGVKSDINVTPLVDVVLVLLIIFMVIAPQLEAGERVELPDTRPWSFRGHAIECRINAEDPKTFAPWPGVITEWHPPGGAGLRVDSGVYGGWRVPADYDSLLAKLIAHAPTRQEALIRMRRALEEYVIGGIDTTIPLHQRLAVAPEFIDGDYDIHWLEKFIGRPV